jgi:single-stranded-DNA-specific exonuclease
MVFAGEGWHEGVIGIVASRLVERYGKPCLVLSVRDGIAKGSGRSLPGFSLFEAVSRSAPLMQKFGGHAMAAGFTLAAADVERFREEINAYAAEQEMPFPSLQFDARLDPASLGPELCDEIALLEPFGAGNTQPLFMLRDVELVAATPISGGKHLRLTLRHGEGTLTAMRFHQSREEFCFSPGDCVDAAVMLEPNEYMGQRGVSVIVRELKYSRLPNDALLAAQRLTENVLRGEVLEPALADRCRPDREAVVKIYRTLQKGKLMLPEAVFLAIGADFLRQADAAALARLWIAAEVLCELGLAAVDGIGRMGLTAPAQKVNLEDSTLLRRLAREVGSTA